MHNYIVPDRCPYCQIKLSVTNNIYSCENLLCRYERIVFKNKILLSKLHYYTHNNIMTSLFFILKNYAIIIYYHEESSSYSTIIDILNIYNYDEFIKNKVVLNFPVQIKWDDLSDTLAEIEAYKVFK